MEEERAMHDVERSIREGETEGIGLNFVLWCEFQVSELEVETERTGLFEARGDCFGKIA